MYVFFFLIIILYPRDGYCLCGLIKYKYKYWFELIFVKCKSQLAVCSISALALERREISIKY